MENKYRRMLKDQGYALRKSNKPISPDNLGGYMIVDIYSNCVAQGSRYELSLNDVRDFLDLHEEIE